MTLGKRLFDILFALVIVGPVTVLVLGVALAILVRDGRPVFYLSERMKDPTTSFLLWKFRTMHQTANDSGVSGGDKAGRITGLGRALRRARLDELPQLWNILRGDMSFVGPRPPLRSYVERQPALYAQVLQSRPGVTGLASLRFHRREEALLSRCRSAAETDAVYMRRCVPQKARLDLIYQRNQSVCFDLRLIGQTLAHMIFGQKRHSFGKKPPNNPA